MNAFAQAFAFVVSPEIEGGPTISNDPDDPGKLTKWGISQRAHPDVDIQNLTYDQARAIYRVSYWDRCRCDEFQPQLGFALFDSAVNQGPDRAIRLLQRSLRVEDDGVIGPDTISAAGGVVGDDTLIEFLSHRAVDYAYGNPKYRRGWMVRLFRVQRAAWSLA